MPRSPSSGPNDVELQLLGVLWERGASTVRQVHDAIADRRRTGVSSTAKMLQVMAEKGMLVRLDDPRPIRYRPAESTEATQAGIVRDLVDRVFGGAAEKLILRAVSESDLTADQLAAIRRRIDQMERQSR